MTILNLNSASLARDPAVSPLRLPALLKEMAPRLDGPASGPIGYHERQHGHARLRVARWRMEWIERPVDLDRSLSDFPEADAKQTKGLEGRQTPAL